EADQSLVLAELELATGFDDLSPDAFTAVHVEHELQRIATVFSSTHRTTRPPSIAVVIRQHLRARPAPRVRPGCRRDCGSTWRQGRFGCGRTVGLARESAGVHGWADSF